MPGSRRYSGALGGPYPLLLKGLRVGPDLAFELSDARDERIYEPSMRLEYLRERLRLDLRLGLELNDLRRSGRSVERESLFYRIGYRYDF